MAEPSLENLRHSSAHVLAAAILHLFPGAKFGVGPTIPEGFYYDIDLPKKLSHDDLPKIEKEMQHIIKKNYDFEKKTYSIKDARELFAKLGQPYKVELIDDLAREGTKEVTVFETGDFIDLCRGGHVGSTKEIKPKAIKLTKIAGAYWKGEEKNKQLQRIYGVAFSTEKELKDHLDMLEKAKEHDHRRLGQQLGIFVISNQVGQGLPLWLPKGALMRQLLKDYLNEQLREAGYLPVSTPHIGRLKLYKTSGHYPYYKDSQYSPIDIDGDKYLLKPMNCPHHIIIYSSQPRSYRDLPLRLAEFGTVYRYEKSGELSGLIRVRGFTIDDAHTFATPEQVADELASVIDLIKNTNKVFGFKDFRARIGVRDPKSNKFAGDSKVWEKAEQDIVAAAKKKKIPFTIEEGEAAFYGPKLDFLIKDSLGREWQLGTVQLDYVLPERFKLKYTGADGKDHRPVMIHRAPYGSLDRFIGILIEHYAGAFPMWLSPVQIAIIPVSEKFIKPAQKLAQELSESELRVFVDERNESVGRKIHDAESQKYPYTLVFGEKEMKKNAKLAIRVRGKKKLESLTRKKFLERLQTETEKRK